MEEKKKEKQEKREEERRRSDTFESVANAYLDFIAGGITENHLERQRARLANNIFPYVGERPITEISRADIIEAVKRIEERGAIETAHRVFAICNSVFKFAAANEKIPYNILADVDKKNILSPAPEKHYPTITDKEEVGRLLHAIDGYMGEAVTRYALQLIPFLAVRPGNFRNMKWKDIDIANSQWIIPGEEMKVKRKKKAVNDFRPHVVPLSLQAIQIIEKLRPLTGNGPYVLPSARSKSRPMSNNTLNAALIRLGYKGQLTPHSFRAMFSTIAHGHIEEHGHHSDVIERQLDHEEPNAVKRAYNHSEYLPQRRELMQWWGDWLDEAKRSV
jgi:integrase